MKRPNGPRAAGSFPIGGYSASEEAGNKKFFESSTRHIIGFEVSEF